MKIQKVYFLPFLKNLNYDTKNVGQKLKPDDRRKHIIEIIEGNSQILPLIYKKYLMFQNEQ